MSDDQTKQPEEAPKAEENNQAAQSGDTSTESQPAQSEGPQKKKKINKLTLEEINKIIEELENKNQIQSNYYQHLQHRKDELQSA